MGGRDHPGTAPSQPQPHPTKSAEKGALTCGNAEPYYADEHVTLYHGDCREIDAWLAADVLVTDPPYGVQRTIYSRTTTTAPVIRGERATGRAANRVLTREDVAVRDDALALWGSGPALVFGSWRAPRPADTRMRLIWDRGHLGNGGVRPWRPVDEEIYLCGSWPNGREGSGWTARSSILRFRSYPTSGPNRPDHPTPKPVSLMLDLLECCPAGTVTDPFVGSGSTLLAAKTLGRRAIGVEIDEQHCELAARRLSEPTLFDGEASA